MSGIVLLVLRILMAVGLFIFLGLAIWIIWKDLLSKTRQLTPGNQPIVEFRSRKENQVFTIKRQLYEFELGRDPTCEISIKDKSISTKHARFGFHHNHWWVEDLASTNGTFLNGERITSAVVLSPGDILGIGKIELEIILRDCTDNMLSSSANKSGGGQK